jgi:hypothetical protein
MKRCRLHFYDWEDLRGQLDEWLQQQAEMAPESPSELLDWWPRFKWALVVSLDRLNSEARNRAVGCSDEQAEAAHNYDTLLEQHVAAIQHGSPGLAEQVVDAKRKESKAALRAAVGAARKTRHDWLRTGERPSPVITRILRPPASSRHIPALRRPNGSATAVPQEMAKIMAAFWADISKKGPTDTAARAQVLDAL